MMKELELRHPPRPRPKLDPRLAKLLELGVAVMAPGELEVAEDATEDFPRSGSLAFLRDGRGGREMAPIDPAAGMEPARRTALPPSVPVFVRATSSAVLDRLAANGIELVSRARTVATANLPLARIAEVEKDEGVVAIEWTGAFRPQTGPGEGAARRAACPAIGLDPAQFNDIDGRGVIVGVVDVEGIDLYHPCFVTNRGRTKLLALWDQRYKPEAGDPVGGVEQGPGALGAVYRRSAIGLEIAPHQLVRGNVVPHRPFKGSHGTLTSALAMGNGEDHPEARGVAPGADLIFVNTFGSGSGALGAMTELADAVAFVMNEATAQGKPCVVNVSLGDTLGPHDGTSPIEQFIDELLETEGRAVVIAAGNAHGARKHATATLDAGQTASFSLDVGPRNKERAVIEIWYPAAPPGATLSLEIEAPGEGGRSPVVEADGVPRAFEAGTTRVLALSMPRYPGPAGQDAKNGVIRIELLPREPRGELLAGKWQFHLRASGAGTAVHAWVDHRYARWDNASDTLTLTTPATARRAIVVGAYDAESDDAAWFSGRGKDRGGLDRPDLLAPGVSMVGAWAESTVRYIATAGGTSVAAPLVAGAAALVFATAGGKISAQVGREKVLALSRGAANDKRRLWVAELPSQRGAPAGTASPTAGQSPPPGEARSAGRLPLVRPHDRAQIMEGWYKIEVGSSVVGEILVLPGEQPNVTVEHWALGPDFRAPSAESPRVSLEIQYMGRAMPLDRFLARFDKGARHRRAVCAVARANMKSTQNSASAMSEEANKPTESQETMKKNYMQPLDRTQIMEGTYELYQGTAKVGKLLVTFDNPGKSTEHWLLYSEYSWPSASNTEQELRFQYQSEAIQLTSFLSSPPTGATYIIAACEQQTLP